jgi:hypothetical protein
MLPNVVFDDSRLRQTAHNSDNREWTTGQNLDRGKNRDRTKGTSFSKRRVRISLGGKREALRLLTMLTLRPKGSGFRHLDYHRKNACRNG